jgi:hypothetical protein
MFKCKICLNKFQNLYFNTGRMKICGRCINTLNNYNKTAESAYKEIGLMHRRGMEKKIYNALNGNDVPEWRKIEADKIQGDFESEYEASLPKRINELLSDNNIPATNKTKKIIRAERLGILYRKEPLNKGYPNNWNDRARKVRKKDHLRCNKCRKSDLALDVHHIVHVSNFGMHRQNNLVTLCRDCHQNEHDHSFNVDNTRYDVIEIIAQDDSQKYIKITDESVTNCLPPTPEIKETGGTFEDKNDSSTIYCELFYLLDQTDVDVLLAKEKIKVLKEAGYSNEDITNKLATYGSHLANESLNYITDENQTEPKIEKQSSVVSSQKDNRVYWDKYWYIFVILGVIVILLFG